MTDLEEAHLDTIFKIFKPNPIPRIFIETGTYRGDSTSAVIDKFCLVHTIELSEAWYKNAKEKFKDNKNVVCHLGDSPEVLAQLLPSIHEPVVFFLDAHYAGVHTARGAEENPLLREIKIISKRKYRDIVIIHDAELLGMCREGGTAGDPIYPAFMCDWRDITIDAIKENLGNKNSNFFYKFREKHLIIFTNQSKFLCFIFRIKFVSVQFFYRQKIRLKKILKKFLNIPGLVNIRIKK